MEEIEVIARFLPGGKIIPLSFVWNGITYNVDSLGRNWITKDEVHMLVMDTKNQVFHLVFQLESAKWKILPHADSQRISTI